MYKTNLREGQRVKCYRTHDKSTQLTGTIVSIDEGDDDLVQVETDEANGSVSRVETVHASDVQVIPEKKTNGNKAKEKAKQAATAAQSNTQTGAQ